LDTSGLGWLLDKGGMMEAIDLITKIYAAFVIIWLMVKIDERKWK